MMNTAGMMSLFKFCLLLLTILSVNITNQHLVQSEAERNRVVTNPQGKKKND